MRLYADSSKCSGCNACRVACSINLFGETNPKKAALIIEPHFPAPGVYNVKVCTQCGSGRLHHVRSLCPSLPGGRHVHGCQSGPQHRLGMRFVR
jgi:Fe-S-cluster-containing dehydrogenase component